MQTQIAVAIDGNAIDEDLHRLIRCGEEQTLVHARIGRNVDTYPNIMCSLGHGNAELWVEFPPAPLLLGDAGTLFAAFSSTSGLFGCQYSHESSEVSAETV